MKIEGQKVTSLHNAIKHVAYAMATDYDNDIRYTLNAVMFDVDCLVATDSHRLSMYKIDNSGYVDKKFLLSRKAINIIAKEKEIMSFKVGTEYVQVSVPRRNYTTYAFRKDESSFPNYKNVIPTSGDGFRINDKCDVIKNIKWLSSSWRKSDGEYPIVVIDLEKKQISVGQNKADLDCRKIDTSCPNKIGFLCKNFIDMISKADTYDDSVTIFKTTDLGPAYIQTSYSTEIIMPNMA